MTSPSDLSGWVIRIYDQWNETGIATSRGVSWFQNNLFRLNTFINSAYYMSGEYIVPQMTQMVSGIYEEMYYCYYLDKQANQAVGASTWDWTEISGEEQGTFRRVSRNEVSKTYRGMSNDCQARLDELIKWYLRNTSCGALAAQVLYGDRGNVADQGLIDPSYPPSHCYSPCNGVWTTLSL